MSNPSDPEGREQRMEDLLRSQREMIARLDTLAHRPPGRDLLAEWDRLKAAGQIMSVSDLPVCLLALEKRVQELEEWRQQQIDLHIDLTAMLLRLEDCVARLEEPGSGREA